MPFTPYNSKPRNLLNAVSATGRISLRLLIPMIITLGLLLPPAVAWEWATTWPESHLSENGRYFPYLTDAEIGTPQTLEVLEVIDPNVLAEYDPDECLCCCDSEDPKFLPNLAARWKNSAQAAHRHRKGITGSM